MRSAPHYEQSRKQEEERRAVHDDHFRAIAIVGVVTGQEPEPSTVITGGFRRRADLRELDPLPLELLRDQAVMSLGPNLVTSAIYDAARSFFRPGRSTMVFNLSFKETRHRARKVKVHIEASNETELRAALDRLPDVLRAGTEVPSYRGPGAL